MKTTRRHCAVWVTVPDRRTARRLAHLVLEARVAACVNIVPGIESHYWWKGARETGRELLLMMKTLRKSLPALEQLVLSAHPYETPEFVVVPLDGGSERYLDWIEAHVGPVDTRGRRAGSSRASR